MANLIAGLIEPLLQVLLPSTGHRRRLKATHVYTRSVPAAHRRLVICRAVVAPVPGRFPPLRGEDSALVRRYVLAEFEPWEYVEERLRQRRQRALGLAVQDAGPRVIHGMGVA